VTLFGARAAAPVVMAAMLLACSSTPKPTQVAGAIEVSAQANPSVSGRPSPLMVRVYELKSAAAFNSADFMSLYERDQATLGPEMIGREEFVLPPGANKPYAKTLSPETRFLGFVAAFRDLDRAQWRSTLAIQPGKSQKIVVRASALAIEAAPAR
jgi:type VI secretion system protein VasD